MGCFFIFAGENCGRIDSLREAATSFALAELYEYELYSRTWLSLIQSLLSTPRRVKCICQMASKPAIAPPTREEREGDRHTFPQYRLWCMLEGVLRG